jgi:succinate dehydrogenase / fumarate reductase cytochrome b subunit
MITTESNRPVFLDLLKIRLPVGGVMSIGHRVSGVFLALSLPPMIYLLERSVSGADGLAWVGEITAGLPFAVFLFLVLWALMHHFLAGIRHLLMDLHVGLDSPRYRQTALAVLVAAPVLALVLTGVLR